MHRILYFGGLASGAVMLILSILIWFKLGIRKAFRDVLSYGSRGKWLVDPKMLNKTMPLRKTDSGRIITGATVKKTTNKIKNNKIKNDPGINNSAKINSTSTSLLNTYHLNIINQEETTLLENYHGQILKNHKENINLEIIEEINLIAGGR